MNQSIRRSAAVASLLTVVSWGAGCGSPDSTRADPKVDENAIGRATPSDRPGHVFVVAMDAASAFYFGLYGDRSGTSPFIDSLSEEWVVFDRAYSQAPNTVPSTASLITGVRPGTHLVGPRNVLSGQLPTMAEILGDAGYRTLAIVGNPRAGSPALGFDRGYEKAVQAYRLPTEAGGRVADAERKYQISHPAVVNELLFASLDEWQGDRIFAYVHYLQPHGPYDPPVDFLNRSLPEGERFGEARWRPWPEVRRAFHAANQSGLASLETVNTIAARYRANIEWVDTFVGQLLAGLQDRGLYDDAFIILMSDHGEAFFGHGRFGHNENLYDEMTRIPLLMKLPRREGNPPKRLGQLVETIDLMPTILDYAGITAPAHLEGDSLLRLLRGEADAIPGDEIVCSKVNPQSHSIRVGHLKYIYNQRKEDEIFDLERDPGEQDNLITTRPRLAALLKARLEMIVDLESTRELNATNTLRSDPAMEKLLIELGYIDDK